MCPLTFGELLDIQCLYPSAEDNVTCLTFSGGGWETHMTLWVGALGAGVSGASEGGRERGPGPERPTLMVIRRRRRSL